ncbi:tetraacyldisaccharide 4'-kinase [Ideonella sp. TBM-1]|uniref:Tetraacyldisaccharide 4'-kinase n=1 Tax=Ideonella livida TaxID=2707176 RepID=A0A7C9TIP4_9BURK|nr:tetraacyldisaccharide 4'-kinase [Ideonella livida]
MALERAWWTPAPTPWSRCLQPLASLYGLLSRRRREADERLAAGRTPPCPILVVGNVVVGGAGKTPTTVALVHALRQRGWTPGVVSRGHGRANRALHLLGPTSTAREAGDEPLLIHRRTGAPLAVHADRWTALQALCKAHQEVDVILADDALQHRRLPRDVELLVFDARGAGNGQLLPAGPLREPVPASLGPRQAVLFNAPAPSVPLPGEFARRALTGAVPLASWWQGASADPAALEALARRSQQQALWAAAGLAEPERFFSMLESCGVRLQRLPLPDHHDWAQVPWPSQATEVLVTEKDAVKLPALPPGGPQVWVVPLDFELPDALLQQLHGWLVQARELRQPADPSASCN